MTHSIEFELPDNLYSLLQARAELNNRDIEKEALVIITEELQKAVMNKQRRAKLLSLAGSLDEVTANKILCWTIFNSHDAKRTKTLYSESVCIISM